MTQGTQVDKKPMLEAKIFVVTEARGPHDKPWLNLLYYDPFINKATFSPKYIDRKLLIHWLLWPNGW